jgi:DNA invertase Pin-like site-specific DNA recombinase
MMASRSSERTRAALQAAKARGQTLGSLVARQTVEKARAARSVYAAEASAGTRQVIADIRASGVETLTGIAKALQASGIKTPRGNANWQAGQVARMLRGVGQGRPAQVNNSQQPGIGPAL